MIPTPHNYIADLAGHALENGTITIGVAGQDPDLAPLPCYWDMACTLPVAQPIAISQGYIVHAGARADIYTSATGYSMRVRDQWGREVDFIANSAAVSSAASLNSPAFTGTPTAPTQAASDQSNALATDAFVWAHGLAYPGALSLLMASTVLTASALGGGVYVQGSNVTVTLPDLTLTLAGQTVTVVAGPNGCQAAPVAGQTIQDASGNLYTGTTMPLAAGATVMFTSQGSAGPWQVAMAGGASAGGSSGTIGMARALAIATSPSGASVTATSIVLGNISSGMTMTASNVAVTAGTSGTGANALDSGTAAASSWYYVWVIYNPTTQTTAGLLSTSIDTPTLPAGYTFGARVGAVRTDTSATLLPMQQCGRQVQYVVTGSTYLPLICNTATGSVTTPTWSSFSVAGFVPPTAGTIRLLLTSGALNQSAQAMAAPNSNYGAFNSITNPPPLMWTDTGNQQVAANLGEFVLESSDIYYAAGTNDFLLQCFGWEDNL